MGKLRLLQDLCQPKSRAAGPSESLSATLRAFTVGRLRRNSTSAGESNDVKIGIPGDIAVLGTRSIFPLTKRSNEIRLIGMNESLLPLQTQPHPPQNGPQQPAWGGCIVPLGASDQGTPLFCIHPSGGDIGIYRKLVRRMRLKNPIIGIQSRLKVGAQEEFASVELMAEYYEQLIVRHQPKGPITLLGFSFGGFVASAISSLLVNKGREVSFLGLIDSDLRWIEDDTATHKELTLRLVQLSNRFQEIGMFNTVPEARLEKDVEDIAERSLGPSRFSSDDMLEFLHSRGYTDSQSPHAATICRFTSEFLTHCNMVRKYRVGTVEVPMKFWWPSDPETDIVERREAWQAHATHKIAEAFIPGTHFSIMRMPSVHQLADLVRQELGS